MNANNPADLLDVSTNARVLLKRTTSRCPTCQVSCPAEVWLTATNPRQVWLTRTCPDHGEVSVCIASDARFYWLAKGNPGNACCAGSGKPVGTLGRNAGGRFALTKPTPLQSTASGCCEERRAPFEALSTCLALIEIVNSCNLACPTCYADSPVGSGARVDAAPLEDLKRRIQGVIDRKGGIEILQLSAGEPTLHPQFFELVEWAQTNPGIDYLLLNTNGLRIANDEDFACKLAEAVRQRGIQLYLQFDGAQLDGQHSLRGADLRPARERAIRRCAEMKLPITLAMTVTRENLLHVWQAIEFGLKFEHVRGISFQPLFRSGRLPGDTSASGGARATCESRLNTADIIVAAVDQSAGRLRYEDFTPLPCGDPNCATVGYLLKANGRTYSISDFIDFAEVQDFLRDKVRYNLEDLARCGCDSQPLGDLLRRFEMDESNTFRLFVKPFMDAWTWDEDRIDRCCTHVIRPDGKLDSFCRYYSGFADMRAAP